MQPSGQRHRLDYVFISLALTAVGLGLLLLSSASSVVSFQKFGTSYYYVNRQLLFGLLPGLLLFLVFARIDYHRLARWSTVGLVLTVLALVAVVIPGLGIRLGGASRWLDVRLFSFQPSELAKLTFLLYLAPWLASRSSDQLRSWRQGALPFVALVGMVVTLLLLQPDLGTAIIIVGTACALFFAAGARPTVMLSFAASGGGLLWLLIKVAPYRLQRFTVFFNPQLDPQGIGYHINQALLAVGSGGFWGLGLGHSRQKYQYLPEVTGDSIFAVVAEELGFLFTSLLVLLLVALVLRGLAIAKRAPNQLGRLLAFGIISWLALQILVNVAAMLGLLPLTGIPLPLISHGGTALAVVLAGLGIVVNISGQTRAVEVRR